MLNKAIIFSFLSLIAIMSACTEDTAPVAKPVADKITMNINGKDWTADSTSLTLSVNKKFYVLRGEKYITTGSKKTLGEVMIFNLPSTIKNNDVISLPDFTNRDLDMTFANYATSEFFVLTYDSRGKGQINVVKFDGKRLEGIFSGSIYYANDLKEVKTGVISVAVK